MQPRRREAGREENRRQPRGDVPRTPRRRFAVSRSSGEEYSTEHTETREHRGGEDEDRGWRIAQATAPSSVLHPPSSILDFPPSLRALCVSVCSVLNLQSNS